MLGSSPNPNPSPHLLVGKNGELTAWHYLQSQYYILLARNVRVGKKDEIDIIAFDPIDNVLAFVEVKARAQRHREYVPELNLTWTKKHRISRAAQQWVMDNDYDGPYRLDLLCVVDSRVTAHYRDLDVDEL